jgi:hypothetical protein
MLGRERGKQVTYLAYFTVFALPIGLLALLSFLMCDPSRRSIFFGEDERARWWEGGVVLAALVGYIAAPFILLWMVVAALGWASRTLGWWT